MTNRDWAALAIKLGALWLCLTEIIDLVRVPVQWMGHIEGHPGHLAIVVASHLVPIALGLYIWLSADSLAARLCSEVSPPAPLGADREGLLSVGLLLMGVWFVSRAVSTLAFYLLRALFAWQDRPLLGPDRNVMQKVWDATAKASMADGVIGLLIGIGLILGTERLRGLLLSVRHGMMGTGPDEPERPE
jgi:hypothetical protein